MRTRHFLAVLAGVALASCVTDKGADFIPQNDQTKITFSSPVMYDNSAGTRAGHYGEVGNHSYGTQSTYSYPRAESFHIYAVKHANDFAGWESADAKALFDDTDVSYDGSLDGWAPKKPTGNDPYYYWPADMKISYAACSPADMEQGASWTGSRTYGKTGLVITDFKVASDASKQFDLMFSKRAVNKTKDDMLHDAAYYSGVEIEFQHALSSIHFSLKNETSAVVALKKITLYGVSDVATFNENITESAGKYVINENVNPAWTNYNNPSTDISYVAFDAGSKAGLTFPIEAQYISNLLTQEANVGAGDNHVLLLLPQGLTDAAKLRVDYTVDGVASHKIVNLKDARHKENATLAIDKWEIGTSYTYRLVYSAAAASQDKVYFSPKTDGWKNAGVAVIDLAGGSN